jgi:glycogen(starch) synthase
MRVGIFTPTYPGITKTDGGIGTYTRDLGRALATRGHEVSVLAPVESGAQDGAVAIHPTSYRYVRGLDKIAPGLGPAGQVSLALRRLHAKRRFDLIELPQYDGPAIPWMLPRRTPVFVRLYTSSVQSFTENLGDLSRPDRWNLRRERWLVRAARAVVTHSRAHARALAPVLDFDPEKITIIPLGVNPQPDYVRPARDPDAPLEVVFLGRLEHRKGAIDLIRAIPAVGVAVPGAKFTLIGLDRPHAPGDRTHEQYVRDEFPAELRARIHFAGRLPDDQVDAAMQRADLFVAPSRYESFGLIYLEALRWGTPVVGTTAGGIPEVVEDGVTGVLVAPESPPELADAIIGLLRDPDRRRALAEAGRRRAEGDLSTETMGKRVEAFYQDALSNGRRS